MSPSIRGGSPSEDEKEEEQVEEDSDADDDVEEIDLGISAAPAPAPVEEAVTPGNGWDGADDEMEAEFEQALEDQAKSDMEDVAVGAAANGVSHAVVESSEESEEE